MELYTRARATPHASLSPISATIAATTDDPAARTHAAHTLRHLRTWNQPAHLRTSRYDRRAAYTRIHTHSGARLRPYPPHMLSPTHADSAGKALRISLTLEGGGVHTGLYRALQKA